MKKNNSKSTKSSQRNTKNSILVCLIITLSISFVLLLVSSVVLSLTSDPDRFIGTVSLICCLLSSFFCGCVAKKKMSLSGIKSGFLMGGIFVGFLLLLSLFFRGGTAHYSPLTSGILYLFTFLLAPFGAFLSGRQKKAPKRKRKY